MTNSAVAELTLLSPLVTTAARIALIIRARSPAGIADIIDRANASSGLASPGICCSAAMPTSIVRKPNGAAISPPRTKPLREASTDFAARMRWYHSWLPKRAITTVTSQAAIVGGFQLPVAPLHHEACVSGTPASTCARPPDALMKIGTPTRKPPSISTHW